MATTLARRWAMGLILLVTGMIQQGIAANVAEYYGIPLAALHYFPARGQRPAHSDPAVAVDPLHDSAPGLAALARDEVSL